MLANQIEGMRNSLSHLHPRSQKKYLMAVGAQAGLAILDILGIALLGIIGALAISGVQSQSPSSNIFNILRLLRIEELSFQSQVAIISVAAVATLIIKTSVSIILTRKTLIFLTNESAILATNLTSAYFDQDLQDINSKRLEEIQYNLGPGISSLVVGILGNSLTLLGDIATLIVVAVGIVLLDASIAVTSILIFGIVSTFLYKYLQSKSRALAFDLASMGINSNVVVSNLLNSYREIFTMNRKELFLNRLETLRHDSSKSLAEQVQLPNIAKYLLEIVMILGSLVIAGLQFYFQDAQHAVSSLVIFVAASTRIIPALLRIQQALVQINASIGASQSVLNLFDDLKFRSTSQTQDSQPHASELLIRIENLSFRYPSRNDNALDDISLQIPEGSFVALVGPSGSGKSTLVDLILGLNTPTSGEIRIAGHRPQDLLNIWRNSFGYVPQVVNLIDGTIAENIALGLHKDEINMDRVYEVARLVQLDDLLESSISLNLLESKTTNLILSGGQTQRIGIARALYEEPRILILDESTSALDSKLELEISSSLNRLREDKTLIVIAHRLSSVQQADLVFYFDSGKLRAQGTFEDIREKVSDFDQQAKLMGL
jgi:ATP-binding cassette subfamily C protein